MSNKSVRRFLSELDELNNKADQIGRKSDGRSLDILRRIQNRQRKLSKKLNSQDDDMNF